MNIDSGDLLPFMYLPDGSMSPLFPATQVSHTSLTICPMRSGNSAPVLTTYSSDAAVWFEMPEARMISVSPLYLGRLGENRLSDNVKVGFEVEFNGEVNKTIIPTGINSISRNFLSRGLTATVSLANGPYVSATTTLWLTA